MEEYWTERYKNKSTGWDVGYPSTPIKSYIDQLTDKSIRILIPGAGNAYEAEYLWSKGFNNVYIMDVSNIPLDNFKKRNPSFPSSQLIHQDFFEHQGVYDLILEQTFFCSFEPLQEVRNAYVKKMHNNLSKGGKLVGVWFDIPLTGDLVKRPFGGDINLYLSYLSTYFETKTFDNCYNSIPEREAKELFGVFIKK